MNKVYVCFEQDFYTYPPVAVFEHQGDAKRFCKHRNADKPCLQMKYKRMYVFTEFKTNEELCKD